MHLLIHFREFIEIKELNVEKFYNEDNSQDKDDKEKSFSKNCAEVKNNLSLNVNESNDAIGLYCNS